MTVTVAPAINALFGSVIWPISDASADCACSVPRSSTPSITPRTNLRMDTPVHFSQAEKGNRSDSPIRLIRQISRVCTSCATFLLEGQKLFCLEKHLQSDVCFVARLAEAR